ncbi:hypothetical protein PWT90_05219 [Aphanocladium album]|nr:hypothetical protein PWT90_05219 [Aphanocladium album]
MDDSHDSHYAQRTFSNQELLNRIIILLPEASQARAARVNRQWFDTASRFLWRHRDVKDLKPIAACRRQVYASKMEHMEVSSGDSLFARKSVQRLNFESVSSVIFSDYHWLDDTSYANCQPLKSAPVTSIEFMDSCVNDGLSLWVASDTFQPHTTQDAAQVFHQISVVLKNIASAAHKESANVLLHRRTDKPIDPVTRALAQPHIVQRICQYLLDQNLVAAAQVDRQFFVLATEVNWYEAPVRMIRLRVQPSRRQLYACKVRTLIIDVAQRDQAHAASGRVRFDGLRELSIESVDICTYEERSLRRYLPPTLERLAMFNVIMPPGMLGTVQSQCNQLRVLTISWRTFHRPDMGKVFQPAELADFMAANPLLEELRLDDPDKNHA